MRLFATTLVALVSSLAPASAQSTIIAQSWGIQLPTRFIDFGSFTYSDGTVITTQYPGVTFSHAAYFTAAAPNNNVAGGFLGNDYTATGPDTLIIRFGWSLSAVSFVYHQIGTQGPSTFRAKYQGGVVELFTIQWNETQPNNFFGFTECLVDEVQIDFVGDFRIDQLAYNPELPGRCHWHNGSGVNPGAFLCATDPIIGSTWHGTIANTPNTVLSAIIYSPVGLQVPPIPLFGGELVVHPQGAYIAFVGTTDHLLPIPASSFWVGTLLAFQGLRLDLVGGALTFVPLNAQLLQIGL
jgi:hypothetical protein